MEDAQEPGCTWVLKQGPHKGELCVYKKGHRRTHSSVPCRVADMTPSALEHHRSLARQHGTNRRGQPGPCSRKGCDEPRRKFRTGKYSNECIEHGREAMRKFRGSPAGVLASVREVAKQRESVNRERLARGFL